MKSTLDYAIEALENAGKALSREELTSKMQSAGWTTEATKQSPIRVVGAALVENNWSVDAFRIGYILKLNSRHCDRYFLRSPAQAAHIRSVRLHLMALNDNLRTLLIDIHGVAAWLQKQLPGYPWGLDGAGGADLRRADLRYAKLPKGYGSARDNG